MSGSKLIEGAKEAVALAGARIHIDGVEYGLADLIAAVRDLAASRAREAEMVEALTVVFSEFDSLVNRGWGGELPCTDEEAAALERARAALATTPAPRTEAEERTTEANADLVKWGVHVLGADDWYPAATHADAVRMAGQGNALCARHVPDGDILWFAYAGPWPGSADEHEAALRALAPAAQADAGTDEGEGRP